MKRKKKITPYLLILPSMFFLVLFIYYPAVKTLFKSLFLINSSNIPVKFVGLGNYRKLFSDETFLKSIVVTFEYALVVIPVTILMGYLLALISASGRRLSPVYELMYAMPMAVSMSVASVIFKLLLNGNLGFINHVFHLNIMWFTDKKYALWAIIIIGIWMGLGMTYIFLLSAVRSVSEELLEAATAEGAGIWQKVRYIYTPMISPTLFYLFCVNVGSALMMSGPVIILTQGGPDSSTSTIMYYIYQKGFYVYNYGLSYSAAVVGFIIGFTVILISFIWEKRGVHY